MFESFQRFFEFYLLSNCITWGYWSLVMHEITLDFIGSINAFLLHRYFLRSMFLVTTLLNGWRPQMDTASANITVRRMSSLLLILSTFFDDNGGAGSTHKIHSSCNCVLLKDCWIWLLVLVAEDSVEDCPWGSCLPSELPASVSKTPKRILPISLFGCRYGSDELGVPT